jgi:hypothetical protein
MKLNWSHENFRVLGIDFSLDLNCITDINFTVSSAYKLMRDSTSLIIIP